MDLFELEVELGDTQQGLWFDLHDSKFKIAYMGHEDFQFALSSKMVKGEIAADAFCDCLADHILIDWADVYDPEGQIVVYSKDIASHALLTHEELREFVLNTSANSRMFDRVLA